MTLVVCETSCIGSSWEKSWIAASTAAVAAGGGSGARRL